MPSLKTRPFTDDYQRCNISKEWCSTLTPVPHSQLTGLEQDLSPLHRREALPLAETKEIYVILCNAIHISKPPVPRRVNLRWWQKLPCAKAFVLQTLVTYLPSFGKVGSGIRQLIEGRYTHTQRGDLIRLNWLTDYGAEHYSGPTSCVPTS
jgi:hypothetical protein